MNKVVKHLKNNMPIYAVLLVCIVIICISLFATHEKEEEKVDTSMFKVVSLQEALKFFEDDNPRLLVISANNCSATIGYTPYLQIAQARFGYTTYYLELNDIDESQLDDYYKLAEKLDYEYEFMGKTDKFGTFIGSTPMTVIIKNKKQVFGYIGSMSDTTLRTLTNQYGLATRDD